MSEDNLRDLVSELASALRAVTECAEAYLHQIDPEWSGEYFDDSDFGKAHAALAKAQEAI